MQNKTHFADVQAGSVEAVIRDGSRRGVSVPIWS